MNGKIFSNALRPDWWYFLSASSDILSLLRNGAIFKKFSLSPSCSKILSAILSATPLLTKGIASSKLSYCPSSTAFITTTSLSTNGITVEISTQSIVLVFSKILPTCVGFNTGATSLSSFISTEWFSIYSSTLSFAALSRRFVTSDSSPNNSPSVTPNICINSGSFDISGIVLPRSQLLTAW